MNILNDLFDDFGSIFGGKSLDDQIKEELKGKELNKREIEKDGFKIVEENFTDNNITYYSKKVLVTPSKPSVEVITSSVGDTIIELRTALRNAVAKEQYNLAASLRDKLKDLTTLNI